MFLHLKFDLSRALESKVRRPEQVRVCVIKHPIDQLIRGAFEDCRQTNKVLRS